MSRDWDSKPREVGTGTKICGTVPLLKSRGTTNPGISEQESRSVPGRSRCPGILRDADPAWSRETRFGGNFLHLRDCSAGRESRSVLTLFVSRGTGTEVCGTSGTGTNFRGTVPHGCPAGQAGSGQKIAGLSRPLPIPGKKGHFLT